MTNVSQAVDIVARVAPELSALGRALVVAVGGLETHWGDTFPKPDGTPSFNWGAVTAGPDWTGDKFQHGDSHWTPAGNVPHVAWFRAYPNADAGARGLAVLFEHQYAKALAAANRGDWYGAAREMYDAGYYSGTKARKGAILDYFNAIRKQLEAQGIPVAAVAVAGGVEIIFWAALGFLAVKKLGKHGRR
jgi:hypothetical protein